MTVRIYKPAKSAMSSGQGNTHEWVLETAEAKPIVNDPLMGWAGTVNAAPRLSMTFPTMEDAVRYAQTAGLTYTIVEPVEHKPIARSYADNFKFGRIGTWTH